MSHDRLIELSDGRVMDMHSSEFREYLRAEEMKAPPLSPAQKAKLYVLLEPMREELRRRAEQRLNLLDEAKRAHE
jgi:hypothetical protein